ncbi:hypothetical protein LCGC14_0350280 [marine sediment metagenome]|uniref:Uncharacterized protein n=1 Tax=marine sediment metagenome TaxID=412755 RepID=A0A0F9VYI9_9ZZZZ
MTREEIRADRELELGNYQEFSSVDALLGDLHSCSYISCPLCGCVFYPETASSVCCGVNNAN